MDEDEILEIAFSMLTEDEEEDESLLQEYMNQVREMAGGF